MKNVIRLAAGLFLSGLLVCGCSDEGKAEKMLNEWIRSESGPQRTPSRESTPEEAMGLEKPGELAPSVEAWVSSTEFGEYYRQSRENLAVLHKNLVDDFNVRKASSVGPTEYTRELMRNWREAYGIDESLRKFILECYSRKEIRPLPNSLARVFTAKKEAQEKLRRQIAGARSEMKRLSATLSALQAALDSTGDVAWSQKRALRDWRTLQGKVRDAASRAEQAVADAAAVVSEFDSIIRANRDDAAVQGIGKSAMGLKNGLTDVARVLRGRLAIVDGQVTLAESADECTRLESELTSLKAEIASAGNATWADEREIAAWRGRRELMAGIASRAEKTGARASALVQKVRPVIRASGGDASIAAFGARVEQVDAAFAEISGQASEQVTIASGMPQLINCSAECGVLEKELESLKTALEAAGTVSWADKKEIADWRKLQGPAETLKASAGKAHARASALAEGIKPVVRSSKGDKSVAAVDARAERLNAELAAVAKQASARAAVVIGQVPLTQFANACKAMSDGMTKVAAALSKKKARMAEIGNIEGLVRSSRTRNYSDVEELARRTADVKARSLAERKDEVALGQRVQKLVAARESVMGATALYRLRTQVPEPAAHAQIEAILSAFKRAVNVPSDASLPSYFASIESKAFQLADAMEEDALLQRLEDTLRTVQRLAARQR